MSASTEQKDTRTATQRLDDLEKVVATLFSSVQQITQALEQVGNTIGDVEILKRLSKLLNERVAGIIKLAAPETGISQAGVDKFMIDIAVGEMQTQIKGWLAAGLLAPAETVALDSFVVAEEQNADGTVANVRVQFNTQSQKEPYLGKLLGAKAGDVVNMGENKYNLKIQEVYSLTQPKAPEAAAPAPETPAETTAPAVTSDTPSTDSAPATATDSGGNTATPASNS